MYSETESVGAKGEVLIVDDTKESLAYLTELLESSGYMVRAAPTGTLALWTVRSRLPDLILLDVRMPGIDGFEVCRRLKADAYTATVPVIFLSSLHDVQDKLLGFRAGGLDYIGKPFSPDEVLQRISTHIRLARAERALLREKITLAERVSERTKELEEKSIALARENAARKTAEGELRLAASAFDASLSSMFITTPDGVFLAVNPAFTMLTGYSADECLGKHASMLRSDRHDENAYHAHRKMLQTEGKWSGEVWCRRKDGNVFPCLHTISAVLDDSGELINCVGVFLDLSESKDAQSLIEFLTRHDALTGLPNRVLVKDRFSQLVNGAGEDGAAVTVICLNLDRFRFINDFYGYGVGNQVLQWVAAQIAECVSSRDSIFRESGDEFVIVHSGHADLLDIRLIVENLQSNLNTEIILDDISISISASIGVALYPADGVSLEELAGNASIAMSRVKEHGGESHEFFNGQLDHGVRKRFNIAQRLRHAIEREELEVHFQPQVSATTGRVVSAEALLRWRTEDLGLVSPAEFIPVAEETGRIVEIGNWTIRTVCSQIARWQAEGLGSVKIAVNLSAKQFLRQDLCETVRTALNDTGIPPESLELEITEGAIIEDVHGAIATMHALKEIGVTISLDDFGTGYSSLSYLKKFPIDFIKIDQSFVSDLQVDRDADSIVLSIIGLAKHMRMKVIAEGVETEAQCCFLVSHGCDVLQGYFFDRPLTCQKFAERIAQQLAS